MALPLSYNIRNLRQRWKVTLLAVFGIGLVVAVFVTLLAMENGFRIALRSTGSPLNGIITQRGSTSELTSWINVADADVIAVDPHVARDSNGKPWRRAKSSSSPISRGAATVSRPTSPSAGCSRWCSTSATT